MSIYYYPISHETPAVLNLDQAKKQLKMEDLGTFDDDIIKDCIDAAIAEAQNYINSAIFQQKWRIEFLEFKQSYEPKKQHINSLDKVSYILKDGTVVNFTESEDIDAFVKLLPVDRYAKKLHFLNQDSLPDLNETLTNALSIEITCGYVMNTIPRDMLQAIKLLLTDNYNFRSGRPRSESYKESSRVLLEPYKYYTNGK